MSLRKVGKRKRQRYKMHKMKIKNYLLLSIVLVLSACNTLQSNNIFKQFTVGVGTHKKNAIWGRAIRFDTGWSMPSGALACCWEAAVKTTTAYNQPMPKEIYVEWIEESTQLLYRSHVKISPEITKLANNMPSYTVVSSQKKNNGIYLIVGMGKNGEAVIWLSNVRMDGSNISGRVLYVVGKAQAYSEPWIPPSKRK